MLKLSSAQAEQFKSIGAYLRSKRLENTLSLEDIAAITMIRLPLLQALETANLELLPELVYVKGFIRRYGEILKIDGQALANRISDVPEPEVIETPPAPKTVQEPKTVAVTPKVVASQEHSKPVQSLPTSFLSSKTLPYVLLGLGAIFLAGLGYYFLRPQPSTQTTTPKTAPSVVNPSPAVVVPPPPASPSPVPVQPVAQPSPSPVPSATPLSVTVKLEERSWLEIFVDGQLGYRGTLEAGEQKTWTANKAFNIKAGNAGAVKISVNEKPAQPLGKLGEVKEMTLTANAN
ncbi:helix-turn-helix domain-containing protein [Aphanothece hegewaldii]|nr:RodZ domain-containing protein [Aphanothece hegewaldii]